jgi:anti-sigma factor RsiW
MTSPAQQNDPALLVHAYLDGELDPAHVLEVERQLAADPALAAERDRVAALRSLIQEKLPREAPSANLLRRIEAAIGAARPPSRFASRLSSHPTWRALAASMLVALFLGSGSTWLASNWLVPHTVPVPSSTTADLVLASHLRALMAPQPIDVASSDQHTVKPWFNGKIPESPRVVDLSAEGFPLVGGRIDVIGRVPVPTLVYRTRQHLISLTALPANLASASAAKSAIAGYNTVTWTDNGLAYWAVSDLNAPELEAFAKAFRAGTPER